MTTEEEMTLLRSVVAEVCPKAREVLGKRVTEALIHGQTEFRRIPGGDYMDHSTIANGVLLVINFAVALLKLREETKKRRDAGEPNEGVQDSEALALLQLRSETSISVQQQDQVVTIVMRDKRP